MKPVRLIALLTVSVACMAQADSNIVSSANIVGYQAFCLPPHGKMILIGINFSSWEGKDPTLTELIGTKQLRAGNTPSSSDRVLIWNSKERSYDEYAQHPKTRQFYRYNQWPACIPVNPTVPRGTGIWISSAKDSTTTNQIVISGDITIGPPLEDADMSSDMLLIANPFPAKTTVEALTKRYETRSGDQTFFWNGKGYRRYALQPDGNWIEKETSEPPPPVSVGESIWLQRKQLPVQQKN